MKEGIDMKTLQTSKAPQAIGPYSQGIISGDTLYLSGQIALDPETGAVAGNDITTQTKQILSNIGALLEAAGIDYGSVVKTTCFLADMNDFSVFNELYGKAFVSNPARSCVAVKTLPKGVLAEIDVIAELK